MLTLFGHEDSGHAYKVRLMLSVAGIAHEYRWIDIFAERDARPEDFQQHARYHEVPLLIDDGEAYVQSGAILLHLANRHRQFGGETPARFARCAEWLMWEANKIGMCLPQIRAKQRFNDASINAGALEWLQGRYEHDVQLLNKEFRDGRDWILVGDGPSVADFSLCGYLFLADEAKLQVPDGVAAWLQRLQNLPGWANHHELLSKTAR